MTSKDDVTLLAEAEKNRIEDEKAKTILIEEYGFSSMHIDLLQRYFTTHIPTSTASTNHAVFNITWAQELDRWSKKEENYKLACKEADTEKEKYNILEGNKTLLENINKELLTLRKSDLAELTSLANPPPVLVDVLQCVCIIILPDKKSNIDWTASKAVVREKTFLDKLLFTDYKNLNSNQINRLRIKMESSNMNVENAMKMSRAAGLLCDWVFSIYTAHEKYQGMNLSSADQIATINKLTTELKAASDAIGTAITKADIADMKSYNNPYDAIKRLFIQFILINPTNEKNLKESWEESKKLFKNTKLLYCIHNYNKNNLTQKMIAKIKSYNSNELTVDNMRRIGPAVGNLALWITSLVKYFEIKTELWAIRNNNSSELVGENLSTSDNNNHQSWRAIRLVPWVHAIKGRTTSISLKYVCLWNVIVIIIHQLFE